MVRKFSQSLPRKLVLVFPHPTYSGVSALIVGSDILWVYLVLVLSLGLRPSDRSFGSASSGLLIVPKFSLIIMDFRSYRKDCFEIANNVPGSFFLTSVVLVLRQRSFLQSD